MARVYATSYSRMDVAGKAEIFERLSPTERNTIFQKYNMTAERYSAMSAAERADFFGKLTPVERTQVFERVRIAE